MTRLQATASCCASFGELLQGALPHVGHFLVTQAAGVAAAHSGTYLAILIDANGRQHDAQVAACYKNLTQLGLVPQTYHSLHACGVGETESGAVHAAAAEVAYG